MDASLAAKRAKRRRWFRVAALVIGLAGACLCAEVALRVYVASRGWTANCYATGLVFFVPDQQAGHTLRPNLRLVSSTYRVSTNRHGFRGPELALKKSDETVRIAVLGGSSVFGYLVPDGQDSCRELQTLLTQPGQPIEVINAGVPGYNLHQCRQRYQHQVAALQPDVVLLYLGWNDTPFLISEDPDSLDRTPPAPSWSQRALSRSTLYGFVRYRVFPLRAPQFTPPASSTTQVTEAGGQAFRQELQALVEAIRESGAQPVISTQVMAASKHCQDLSGYLGSSPEQVAANRRIGQWISGTLREVAAQEQLPLVDCARQLSCDPEMLGDAIHLTAHGHQQVARLWARELSVVLHPDSEGARD